MSLNEPGHWETMYADHRDGWELGEPPPPLVRAAAWLPPSVRALVIGCGRGHEVRLLANLGWDQIVGVDFAATAIADAERLTPPELAPRITWRRDDLFAIADHGIFDLVLEHTSFCAIDPGRRAEWFAVMHRVVRPGGALLGLFYPHARPGGPPFGGTSEEIERLATEAGFALLRVEVPPDSIARRKGDELLVLATRAV